MVISGNTILYMMLPSGIHSCLCSSKCFMVLASLEPLALPPVRCSGGTHFVPSPAKAPRPPGGRGPGAAEAPAQEGPHAPPRRTPGPTPAEGLVLGRTGAAESRAGAAVPAGPGTEGAAAGQAGSRSPPSGSGTAAVPMATAGGRECPAPAAGRCCGPDPALPCPALACPALWAADRDSSGGSRAPRGFPWLLPACCCLCCCSRSIPHPLSAEPWGFALPPPFCAASGRAALARGCGCTLKGTGHQRGPERRDRVYFSFSTAAAGVVWCDAPRDPLA